MSIQGDKRQSRHAAKGSSRVFLPMVVTPLVTRPSGRRVGRRLLGFSPVRVVIEVLKVEGG